MWLLGWGEQAWSASAVSQFFLGQRNAGSGNNAEYMINLLDTPGTPCQSSGDPRRCAHAGDIFIGLFNLGVLEDQTGGGGQHNLGSGTANNELTGLIAIKVLDQALVSKPGGGSESDQCLGPINPATDIFGPTAAVVKGQMSAGLAAIIGAWNPGTIVALYDDPANDFTRVFNTTTHPGPDDCDAGKTGADLGVPGCQAKEENLLLTTIGPTELFQIGFTGPGGTSGPVEGLIACDNCGFPPGPFQGNDIKALRAINPPVHAGEFNGGLNLTKNNTTLQFGLVNNSLFGLSQFAISGSDLGIGNTATPFDLFSQDNIVFAPSAIPEPSSLTLLLLGTSVLGLSAVRRWKRRP